MACAFGMLVTLAVDARLGVASIVAALVIDWLSFVS